MGENENKPLGKIGEEIVANHLRRKGYTIVEMNYRRKWGELDVIAKKDSVIHFVEVKTVSRENGVIGNKLVPHETSYYRPEENVHHLKLKKLYKAVETWIMDNNWEGDWQIDVAAVKVDPTTKRGTIRIIENIIE